MASALLVAAPSHLVRNSVDLGMLPNVDFSPIANKLGRFSRVNTHWVSGTALEIRPHGWLVGALPGVNRLISGMKNHCDMRSLLASLLVEPVARLESIEIAISP